MYWQEIRRFHTRSLFIIVLLLSIVVPMSPVVNAESRLENADSGAAQVYRDGLAQHRQDGSTSVAFAAARTLAQVTDEVRINVGGSAQALDTRVLGSNLPTWINSNNFADAKFRARTAASGITVLRMPGGSLSNSYGWLSCEMRSNVSGAASCARPGWEAWASRPTDFIDFLQATDIAGMWVVNINGTPEEAAAAVAFFNATTDDTTPIGVDRNGTDWFTAGHWAQLRSDHGNPAPLGIKLWGVGNEVYGGTPGSGGAECAAWGWEDVWTCSGTEYVNGAGDHAGFTAFRTAMRAVDSTIQVGAVGVN